jgi:hypothetical protein
VTGISRKKFVDAPIGLVFERRAQLRDLLAAGHAQPLDEQAADGAYLWRCPEQCVWRITFASLSGVATWLILTFDASGRHVTGDGTVGLRLSSALEAFSREVEAESRTSGAPTNIRPPAPVVVWSAPGIAGSC